MGTWTHNFSTASPVLYHWVIPASHILEWACACMRARLKLTGELNWSYKLAHKCAVFGWSFIYKSTFLPQIWAAVPHICQPCLWCHWCRLPSTKYQHSQYVFKRLIFFLLTNGAWTRVKNCWVYCLFISIILIHNFSPVWFPLNCLVLRYLLSEWLLGENLWQKKYIQFPELCL